VVSDILSPVFCVTPRTPTLWPASTLRFRRATRRLDQAEYDLIPAPGI